ncbi:MAG TPA: DUF3473 domain-containing protein [Gammaproteobacteria bacterium]|nr:DUF3473 domain-containing protein [Gammaproteobacteria bacterium]
MCNAITVDVEDYYQVSAFADTVKREDWAHYPSRVVGNTHRLLDLFDAFGVRATFFVLGWVAERQPGLVREIAHRGHEIACHGYSHQLVYNQTEAEFREETRRARDILQDQAQVPVRGYRAASYSITPRSLWALDVLCELGFRYDSSIFPVRHDRYGMPGGERFPYLQQTPAGRHMVEFPLSTWRLPGYRLPVAGGGYFRLFPYGLTRTAFRAINREGQPFIFYLHPWEVDPDQPRLDGSRLSRFRHYNNLDRCLPRLRRLLQDFRFTTAWDVLGQQSRDEALAQALRATC